MTDTSKAACHSVSVLYVYVNNFQKSTVEHRLPAERVQKLDERQKFSRLFL